MAEGGYLADPEAVLIVKDYKQGTGFKFPQSRSLRCVIIALHIFESGIRKAVKSSNSAWFISIYVTFLLVFCIQLGTSIA